MTHNKQMGIIKPIRVDLTNYVTRSEMTTAIGGCIGKPDWDRKVNILSNVYVDGGYTAPFDGWIFGFMTASPNGYMHYKPAGSSSVFRMCVLNHMSNSGYDESYGECSFIINEGGYLYFGDRSGNSKTASNTGNDDNQLYFVPFKTT